MIEIIATAESVKQAKSLIQAGVDTLYIGNDDFGLRLPNSFSNEQLQEITDMAHASCKKVCVAVNGLMHNEHIERISPFLQFLQEIKVDSITVGDPGVIQIMKKTSIHLPFIYDAQTMVTSARQIHFWVKHGAIGAVLARELTFIELEQISEQVTVPLELLVYGATCIHHSKRPLVENYFNFIHEDEAFTKERGLFLSEPKAPNTHYSVYEDVNGTHIFATDDINLMLYLEKLSHTNLSQWKLDGIFTKGEKFVEIVKLFIAAKRAIINGTWNEQLANKLNEQVVRLHPEKRTLSEGFFLKDPSEVQ